jgi:hypothetical protein
MRLRLLSGHHLLSCILSTFFLVGLFAALFVTAEGVLPLRQRHRPRALIAARQHYKRAFSNDTTDGPDTTAQTSASPTTDHGGGGLLGSLFNDTVDNTNAIVGAPLFQPASSCILLACPADSRPSADERFYSAKCRHIWWRNSCRVPCTDFSDSHT